MTVSVSTVRFGWPHWLLAGGLAWMAGKGTMAVLGGADAKAAQAVKEATIAPRVR